MKPEAESIPFDVMTRGPFAFLWPVPDVGFEWDEDASPALPLELSDARETKGPWLVAVEPEGRQRQYAPLATKGLHRRLAAVRPQPEAILRFANKYGFLKGDQLLLRPDTTIAINGEHINHWTAAIGELAALVELLDLAQQKQAGRLGQIVTWPRDDQVNIAWQNSWTGSAWELERPSPGRKGIYTLHAGGLSNHAIQPDLAKRWGHGNVVEPTKYFVHLRVNKQLRGHVNPAVLPFRQGDIYMFPDSLLSAVYVSFALELSRSRQPRKLCAGCDRYFTPVDGRQGYHSPACRKLHWYHKQKEKRDGKKGN